MFAGLEGLRDGPRHLQLASAFAAAEGCHRSGQ
jgi:hypothetical protein